MSRAEHDEPAAGTDAKETTTTTADAASGVSSASPPETGFDAGWGAPEATTSAATSAGATAEPPRPPALAAKPLTPILGSGAKPLTPILGSGAKPLTPILGSGAKPLTPILGSAPKPLAPSTLPPFTAPRLSGGLPGARPPSSAPSRLPPFVPPRPSAPGDAPRTPSLPSKLPPFSPRGAGTTAPLPAAPKAEAITPRPAAVETRPAPVRPEAAPPKPATEEPRSELPATVAMPLIEPPVVAAEPSPAAVTAPAVAEPESVPIPRPRRSTLELEEGDLEEVSGEGETTVTFAEPPAPELAPPAAGALDTRETAAPVMAATPSVVLEDEGPAIAATGPTSGDTLAPNVDEQPAFSGGIPPWPMATNDLPAEPPPSMPAVEPTLAGAWPAGSSEESLAAPDGSQPAPPLDERHDEHATEHHDDEHHDDEHHGPAEPVLPRFDPVFAWVKPTAPPPATAGGDRLEPAPLPVPSPPPTVVVEPMVAAPPPAPVFEPVAGVEEQDDLLAALYLPPPEVDSELSMMEGDPEPRVGGVPSLRSDRSLWILWVTLALVVLAVAAVGTYAATVKPF